MYDPTMAAEAESRVTWDIHDNRNGVCMLTVTHDRLDSSPITASSVNGAGWMTVLSGLKTLLETGQSLMPSAYEDPQPISSGISALRRAMNSSNSASMASSMGGASYSASDFFQSALARKLASWLPSSSHCS